MIPTNLLGPDLRPLHSIISRISLLIDNNTPIKLLLLSLQCLRNFGWGPNIPSLNQDSPWYSDHYITKSILEGNIIIPRIIHILNQNKVITNNNTELLIHCFDLLSSYLEYRHRSIQEIISLGLKTIIIEYYIQSMSINVMKSITSLIGLLVGYTYSDEIIKELLICNNNELEILLNVTNKILIDMLNNQIYDSIIITNIAIILQRILIDIPINSEVFSTIMISLLNLLLIHNNQLTTLLPNGSLLQLNLIFSLDFSLKPLIECFDF